MLDIFGDQFVTNIKDSLQYIERLSDYELVRKLRQRYYLRDFDVALYAKSRFFISKINHGFWEHLAFLFTEPERRNTYRDVGLALRERQYLTSDFLPVLLGIWAHSLRSQSINHFISCTTGAYPFSRVFGDPWSVDHCPPIASYALSSFVRGVVKGLIAFSDLAGQDTPIPVYDSFHINSDFESATLFSSLKTNASPKTACVMVGPPVMSRVRVVDWPGPQFFLGVSALNAMAQWQFNLENVSAVVEHLVRQGYEIVMLFQGAVLGPLVAEHLSRYANDRDIDIRFVDLGRILDMAYEKDITGTGSPLPSRTFTAVGQIELGQTAEFVCQALS
jgi:hypothetical protein